MYGSTNRSKLEFTTEGEGGNYAEVQYPHVLRIVNSVSYILILTSSWFPTSDKNEYMMLNLSVCT